MSTYPFEIGQDLIATPPLVLVRVCLVILICQNIHLCQCFGSSSVHWCVCRHVGPSRPKATAFPKWHLLMINQAKTPTSLFSCPIASTTFACFSKWWFTSYKQKFNLGLGKNVSKEKKLLLVDWGRYLNEFYQMCSNLFETHSWFPLPVYKHIIMYTWPRGTYCVAIYLHFSNFSFSLKTIM